MNETHNLKNPFTKLEGSALESLSNEQSAFCVGSCQEHQSARISDAVIAGQSNEIHR